MPQVVIANRLYDGSVVFLGEGEKWVERIAESRVADDPAEAEQMMKIARRAIEQQRVIGPELIEVERDGERSVPKRRRDRIRVAGPSIRTDLDEEADH